MTIHGALLLDKPVGVSSNAALQRARRLFGAKKAGHGGTLDPLASGLLVAVFGEATKFAGPLLEGDKEYLATLRLGATTTTGDAEGQVVESRSIPEGAEKAIAPVLERFKGEIEQVPPMYSALKRGGVPLYKLARQGIAVEREAREIEIGAFRLLLRDPERLDFTVECSKGTYVRVLAADVGRSLAGQDRLWDGGTRRPTTIVGLEVSPATLEQRIRTRTEAMFERGVVEEVRSALGGSVSRTAEKTLGLREIAELGREEALERIVIRTRRYAAYQRKWMRRIPGIAVVDADRDPIVVAEDVLALERVG